MSSVTKRYDWLDVLKGFGIILVVIGHIYRNDYFVNWIYSVHMPLFFFAGGWLYRKKPIIDDVKRRAKSILVPYFALGGLNLLYWVFIECRFREHTLGVAESVMGLFYAEYNTLEFNCHYWYLPCFFVLTTIFNIIMNTLGEKLCCVIAIVLSIIHTFVNLPAMPWGLDRVCKYMLFYMIGYLFAQKVDGVKKDVEKKFIVIGMFVFLSISFWSVYFDIDQNNNYHITDENYIYYIVALVGILGITCLSILLEKNRILQYIGKNTLVILCIHGPIYRILIKGVAIMIKMDTETVRSSEIWSFLIVALTLLICTLGYEIIVRVAPWCLGKKER